MVKVKTYKLIYKDDLPYYNLCKLMSIDLDIHVSMSIRNLGKSYALMQIIKNDLKKGNNCALLRWDLDEMSVLFTSLLTFLNNDKECNENGEPIYKQLGISSKYILAIYNTVTKAICFIMGVKYAVKYKGFDKDLVGIYYDEFILEFQETVVRRKTEFDKFMSLYNTLKRTNNPRVIFCGNNVDWFNPFTKAWGIMPFNLGEIKVFILSTQINGETHSFKVLWEMVRPTKLQIDRCAQIEVLKGTVKNLQEYFDSVQWTQYNLIDKCDNRLIPLENIQFRYQNKYVSYRIKDGIYYICHTGYRNVPTESPDFTTIKPGERRTKEYVKMFDELYSSGMLRFETGHVYNDFLIMMNMYRTRL